MKTLIIYRSYHHMNTEKVAKALAETLSATLVKLEEVNPSLLVGYDLIGFGSGIYGGKHDKALLGFVSMLPQQKKAAFVFSTRGGAGNKQHRALLDALLQKGFTIKGEFSCAGFDTFGPLKYIGGFRKGRPDAKDLENARTFAKSLMK